MMRPMYSASRAKMMVVILANIHLSRSHYYIFPRPSAGQARSNCNLFNWWISAEASLLLLLLIVASIHSKCSPMAAGQAGLPSLVNGNRSDHQFCEAAQFVCRTSRVSCYPLAGPQLQISTAWSIRPAGSRTVTGRGIEFMRRSRLRTSTPYSMRVPGPSSSGLRILSVCKRHDALLPGTALDHSPQSRHGRVEMCLWRDPADVPSQQERAIQSRLAGPKTRKKHW
ncbi:hypothetical protein VTN77DRAFT_8193 [Rasamsonia byssochlamydoides]|uniref:uncharacterized protein n=1 Tax=Rasamsonia byssochlamydoides TaxID=89139 RepID=UPI003742EEA3